MADAETATLSYAFAREHGIVVMSDGATVRLATRGQARPLALIEARRALGRPLQVERLPDSAFDRHLAERYAVTGLTAQSIETELARQDSLDDLVEGLPAAADLLEIEDEAPIIRLINGLIAEALKVKASDIHVEPFESRLSVRLRVDGLLREVMQLSPRTAPLLVSRIKVMARLDIAEKRLPQDGRISLTIGGRTLDLRVSTLPAQHGERVVMRLLDKSQDHLNIDALGMSPATASAYREALKQPNGVILVTGPTGSGKTTTLYAGLSLLNDQSRNILTIEDPIEYAIEGVGQTQVNARVGLTFAAGLRAILRQDPDVVMVGEIRDPETAQIAVQASLTGHLVLSTVHTNDAVSAITRLRDIGVEPFLLASTVKAIIAQRLVRRLCAHCRQPAAPELSALKVLGPRAAGVTRAWRAVGCPACKGQGYVGRIGLYELVVVGDEIKRLIHDDAPEHALHESAFRAAATLTDAALAHVMAGTTTLEEALRVCRKVEVGDGDV